MAIVCLHCSQTLMELEARPTQSSKAKDYRPPPPPCQLEEDEEGTFIRCPVCHAKNIVAEMRTASGYPQLVVVACRIK
jgi:DNA-directed RNA polymerase subunit RPC12/RpoP